MIDLRSLADRSRLLVQSLLIIWWFGAADGKQNRKSRTLNRTLKKAGSRVGLLKVATAESDNR